MCGLIYCEHFDGSPANEYIFDAYTAQKHRGSEGFGVFNGTHLIKAALEERIVRWLAKDKNASPMIMFHHRWPTSTINCRRAAHPLTTKDYFGKNEYILIHNGMVNNSDELYVAHQELGIEYQTLLPDMTYNDSEALLWDFALTLEGKQEGLKARGSMAIICIKLVNGKKKEMYFGRNSNPLHMDLTPEHLRLSSEGAGDMIKSNTLYTWNFRTKSVQEKFFDFHTLYTVGYSGGYRGSYLDNDDDYYSARGYLGTGRTSKGYFGEDYEVGEDNLAPNEHIVYPRGMSKKARRKYRKAREAQRLADRADELTNRYGGTSSIYKKDVDGIFKPVDSLGQIIHSISQDLSNKRTLPLKEASDDDDEYESIINYYHAVSNMVDAYLLAADFKFSKAYWTMAGDLNVIEQALEMGEGTAGKLRTQEMLEEAMLWLEEDEEWRDGDEDAVSSRKEKVCQQLQLQPA